MEKRRLGRGLDSLLGIEVPENADKPNGEVAVGLIQNNPYQPRKTFDKDELASLSASVRTHGILQPLVVRQVGDQYQLVAGERRLRAAQEVGLASVPVRIVNFNDQQVLEAALIENIQRTDLNPIEKAHGFKDYLDRFKMNHDQLAQRLGLARSTITNLVGFLDLAAEVQEGLRVNQITEAHAKILKGVKSQEQQVAMFKQIVAQGLSVKATEQLMRDRKVEGEAPEPRAENTEGGEEKTAHVKSIEDELRQRFAAPVEIKLRAKDRGQIVLRFESNDDFMRILEVLRR
ncbi:MAG TPA: ParB/RepB/Spo0J family partition protein [Gemmataceae bacterium]|nr:ParB/RepB/Spo0J family partition protein [Gemmataceae bacterium]